MSSLLHNFTSVYSISTVYGRDNINYTSHPVLYNRSVKTDCIPLQLGEYIPWDNPDNIVSHEVEDMLFTLSMLFCLPVLFLIACPANIINMIVFYKHGLKERINVCLFALSLADEVYMITNVLWYGDQFYLRFTTREKFGPIVMFITNNGLLGFHGFIWVSQVLSAIIAGERCFCVLYPLRSQTMLRTSTMIVIIICLHVVILGLVFFEMLRYQFVCAIDPSGKEVSTLVTSEIFNRHRMFLVVLDVFVLGVGLPGFVMIVVITTTVITNMKIRQAALWRASTSSQNGLSERDVALTKMLVVNSVFFVICLIPFVLFRLVFLFMPEVNVGGRKHNFYLMIQELLAVVSYINSSFNIVIYYTMGSRYRQTFWKLFGRKDTIFK